MALKWKNSLIILIFAVCAASPLYAENLKNIQQFYKDYQDFTVNFTQNTFQSLVNKEIRFTGTVSYKRGWVYGWTSSSPSGRSSSSKARRW